jgi:NMD protein affecting ribosome stability and mRNA decay
MNAAKKTPQLGYMVDASLNNPTFHAVVSDTQTQTVVKEIKTVFCPHCNKQTELIPSPRKLINARSQALECSKCHLWFKSHKWFEMEGRIRYREQFRRELQEQLRRKLVKIP